MRQHFPPVRSTPSKAGGWLGLAVLCTFGLLVVQSERLDFAKMRKMKLL